MGWPEVSVLEAAVAAVAVAEAEVQGGKPADEDAAAWAVAEAWLG